MIEDAVDKPAVLATTSDLLDRTPTRRKITDPLVGLGSLLLRRAVRAEQATMTGEPTPSDRRSYIPRDMMLSLFQAQHDEHLGRDRPERLTTTATPRPMASSTLAAFGTAEPFSEGHGIDLGFVVGFLRSLPGHLLRRVFFRLPRDEPREHVLDDDARIVVVGDWGTGEGLALEVGERMREAIAGAGDRQVHVVHLGDVYYAGTPHEARTRFLDPWPVTADPRHFSWCLNGNHDMYSAGEGITGVTLDDPRFAGHRTRRGAVTTEFLVANRHWSLIGVDTSWRFRWLDPRGRAGHLGRRQMRWIRRHVESDAARRTVLFSHHQPFTHGDDGVEPRGNLLDRTQPLRDAGRLTAWFWGHEHKLIAYGARDGVGYATCMGHGAILEAPAAVPPHPGEFDHTFTDHEGLTWRVPGFAVLDLDGPTMTVRYLDRDGAQWRPEDTVPGPG